MSTLKERFGQEFHNVGWIPSERDRILAFFKAELLALAEEFENDFVKKGITGFHQAATIIRNRANEL